jgi:hypothetical protein
MHSAVWRLRLLCIVTKFSALIASVSHDATRAWCRHRVCTSDISGVCFLIFNFYTHLCTIYTSIYAMLVNGNPHTLRRGCFLKRVPATSMFCCWNSKRALLQRSTGCDVCQLGCRWRVPAQTEEFAFAPTNCALCCKRERKRLGFCSHCAWWGGYVLWRSAQAKAALK